MNNIEAHALATVLSGLHDTKLSAGTAYAVARNARLLQPIVTAFAEDRAAIVRECAELDAQGQPLIKDDLFQIRDMPAFESRISELSEREVSIRLQKIDAEDLGQITPNDIMALMPMLAD